MNRKYTSILASFRHKRINHVDDMGKRKWYTMGLFCNGVEVGSGDLKRLSATTVATDATEVRPRKKGHGLHLYIHLIQQARRIKARRIYSSRSLNRFSRRMWAEKLAKIYKVRTLSRVKCPCRSCGSRTGVLRYYIDLSGRNKTYVGRAH